MVDTLPILEETATYAYNGIVGKLDMHSSHEDMGSSVRIHLKTYPQGSIVLSWQKGIPTYRNFSTKIKCAYVYNHSVRKSSDQMSKIADDFS
jgi:hypothetical protein